MSDVAVNELEALAARWPRAAARALLVAPEGLGRSITVGKLAERHEAAGGRALIVGCREGTPAASLARGLLQLGDGPAAPQTLATLPQLADLDELPRRTAAEHLAWLLGHRGSHGATASLDDESRREGAFVELARLLSHGGKDATRLLLVFDDAHRTDEDGAALFDFLSHLDAPHFIVISADADGDVATTAFRRRLTAWRQTEDWPEYTLPPWAPAQLEALLLEHGCSRERAATLAAAGQSSPGLTLGLFRLGDDAPGPLPTTLEALRIARVRRLGDGPLALACRAAALGEVAPLDAVAPDDSERAAHLKALLDAGLFAEVARYGVAAVRCTDARTARGLANQLGAQQLHELNTNAAAWAAGQLPKLTPETFPTVGPLVVPLALTALPPDAASLWSEALACLARGGSTYDDRLATAAASATRVRQLVLLRRRADALLFSGRVEDALSLVKMLSRIPPPASPPPPADVARILASLPRAPLDVWETLSPDAALAAVELTRAECLSHLVKKEEAVKAFDDVRRRLEALSGPATASLWVRWAKTWSWFLCEILGKPADALAACEAVRKRVPAQTLQADVQALDLLRAQEMACSTMGDFERSRQLLDEYLALAADRHSLRDACLGWNGRAILHFGQGELAAARRAFETSLELARVCGWARREAIATHNLALVLKELGEWDAAWAAETRYLAMSKVVGNHAAQAEGPAVLAAVAMGRGDLKEAEGQLLLAQKAAEANGWKLLMAWTRALSGRRRLLRYAKHRDALDLTRAKSDLMAALDVLEEHSSAWTEEMDPGAVYALFGWTLARQGQAKQGADAIRRGVRLIPAQNVVSHQALKLGLAAVEGAGFAEALSWFEERGYVRFTEQWKKLKAAASPATP